MKQKAKTQLSNLLIALSLLVLTGACGAGNDGATNTGAVAQHFEITIDGRVITMNPDAPEDGMVVSAFAVAPESFGLSVFNKKEDFVFQIISQAGPKPGTFDVYACHFGLLQSECEDRDQQTLLTRYPTGQVTGTELGHGAYKDPKLGLTPLTLELISVENVQWPGVGASKRVKGTFTGKLAVVEQDQNGNAFVSQPLKQVEGKFDLYTVLR